MLGKSLPHATISIRDNLVWLYILRNLMVVAQGLLLLTSVYVARISLPLDELWVVILSSCAVNLYTWMRLQTDKPVSELEIFVQITIDVFALAFLLYFTGGASNPIIWVFLLPLILTAIMLPQAYAWNMVTMTCCLYTFLIVFNIPLPAIEPHIPDPKLVSQDLQMYLHTMRHEHYFDLHIFGMWFGFVLSSGLVAFFVVQLSKTLRERERNLAEARENALRDEGMISLGTLAASAAHDMGTPLGTMAIVVHEMELDYPENQYSDLHQKIKIMHQQIKRCKETLSFLSASAGKMRAESGKSMSVIDYIDEVLNQWRAYNSSTKLNLNIEPTVNANAKIIADRTLTHSIINVLNNAVQASSAEKGINLGAVWDKQLLQLKIRDFGPGFPEDIVKLAGKQPVMSSKQGLGVGLFLAYSAINRLGGTIHFINLESGGACVDISLPLFN